MVAVEVIGPKFNRQAGRPFHRPAAPDRRTEPRPETNRGLSYLTVLWSWPVAGDGLSSSSVRHPRAAGPFPGLPKTQLQLFFARATLEQLVSRKPGFIEPCLPTVAAKAAVGLLRIHEIKHDGYRLQGHLRCSLATMDDT
jgi:hypothetical protein